MFTSSEFPNMPWGGANNAHCTDQETDDVATESCTHQEPAAPKPWLPGSRTEVLCLLPRVEGIRAFEKTYKCPARMPELTPTTWAPLGQGRPPIRLGPGPEMFLSPRPRNGTAKDPISSSSHRCQAEGHAPDIRQAPRKVSI